MFAGQAHDLVYESTGAASMNKVAGSHLWRTSLIFTLLSSLAFGLDVRPEVVNKLRRSTFLIENQLLGKTIGIGSGFAVHDNRTIVTAFHVIYFAESLKITNLDNGKVYTFDCVTDLDRVCDTVTMKVKETVPDYLEVYPDQVEQGKGLLIYGNPLGLTASLSTGLVSSVDANRGGMIQIDANLSPGNSGGPVVDYNGKVIGLVSSKILQQGVAGINFVSPARRLRFNRIDTCVNLTAVSLGMIPDYLLDVRPGRIPKRTSIFSSSVHGALEEKPELILEYNQWGLLTKNTYHKHRTSDPDTILIHSYDSYGSRHCLEDKATRFNSRENELQDLPSLIRNNRVSNEAFASCLSHSMSPFLCFSDTFISTGVSKYDKGLQTVEVMFQKNTIDPSIKYFQYIIDDFGNAVDCFMLPENPRTHLIITASPRSMANRIWHRIIEYWE